MKEITSREELNQYYNLVNLKIEEDLINRHKIRPSELIRYIKSNIDEIIEEFGLSEINGAKNIIMDVVSHYYNAELDNIMTFESFSRFYKNSKFM